ncbi:GNAT family N-acetyltransferase [Maribacter sp. 2210JD10-5]|uniref:GNAT family N-acetyltransferase n=1 Tax=Maribacter sp. 2210JD10-5 TaxID=3386272 RepID=UPI0039BC4012
MSINLQPILENSLVLLRPIRVEDFEALYKVANDPLLWKLHQNPDRYKKSIFKIFFKDAIHSKGAFVVIDKATDTIIGSSRFKLSESSEEAIEIGWTFLSRDYWGGLYNKSFKTLMVDYAFQYFKYILFHVDQHNLRSRKAVQKLGGVLIDKLGPLKHLSTVKESGITYVLVRKSQYP